MDESHAQGRPSTAGVARTSSFACSLLAIVQLLACGSGAEQQTPSGQSMGGDREMADRANRPPTIASLSFAPRRVSPGERVQAVANVRDPDGDPLTIEYHWSVNGRRLLDRGPEITVPDTAARASVEVEVIASDGRSEDAVATARFRAANRPPRVTALELETVEEEGPRGHEPHWRARAQVEDPDGDRPFVTYEWIVNGDVIAQGTDVFAKSRVERAEEVRVRATPSDGDIRGAALESASVVVGNSSPRIVSSPPGLDPSGQFRYQPVVRDDDRDTHFSFELLRGPDEMAIDAQTGEVSWTPSVADAGSHTVEIQVADTMGGRSRQRFSVLVQVGGANSPGPAARR